MGQDISLYTDILPTFHVMPNIQAFLPHLRKLKPGGKRGSDFDLEAEIRRWIEGTRPQVDVRACPYGHFRSSIGSPVIHRDSFTDEDIERYTRENDGFPLPSTPEDLHTFDQDAFVEDPIPRTEKKSKKRERQRSKSVTAIPDLSSLKLKLQKIQSPGKPKFLEHLISRVVTKKLCKKEGSGLVSVDESEVFGPEPLSPTSETCLEAAESLVEELLSCSARRPPSGESTDSGKGSLLESTSDLSPTQKRTSWSTPASPTFQGIVKERLKGFQALNEVGNSDLAGSSPSIPSLGQPKSFQESDNTNKEEIEKVKKFYCSLAHDERFTTAVMSKGYVKALVERINTLKFDELDSDTDSVASSGDQTSVTSSGDQTSVASSGDQTSVSNGSVRLRNEGDTCSVKKLQNGADSNAHECSENTSGTRSPSHTPRSSCTNSDSSDSHEEEVIPKDSLHHIAYELLTTERAYVSRLHLLDRVFQFRVTNENNSSNFMPVEAVAAMFSHIKPIYQFHSDFLLPQLEDRMTHWSDEQKIGDIMANLAPFLKLYTGYVKNFDTAMNTIDKWTSQSPKFAALLQKIQQEPECCQLTLQHHMLGPIQRVPRYEMLLKDYLKKLPSDAPDRPDAQKALDLVTEAARHSNTAMKKLEKFSKLLLIIQKLNGTGIDDLVSPTRELIKEGPITKISARSGEKQDRYLFLFNDLLLVCSEQIIGGSYKMRAHLSVDYMEVLPGENINIQNTFCIKCIEKSVEFLDEANNGQGLDWLATFEEVITNFQIKEESKRQELQRVRSDTMEADVSWSIVDHVDLSPNMLGKRAPKWVKDTDVTMCMACRDKFTKLRRRHHCRACGKALCNRCSSKKIRLPYDNNQINRVCQKCYDFISRESPSEEPPPTSPHGPKPRVNHMEADQPSILACFLNMMDKSHTWTKRWITVHSDFVMYFYKKNKDVSAIMTLPLPGHDVKVIGESEKTDKQLDKQYVFCLTHKNVNVIYFQTDTEDQLHQWVRVLEKMVLLELPSAEEKKRLSTHSSESSTSSNTSSLSTIS